MTIAMESTELTMPDLLQTIERGEVIRFQRNGETVATLQPVRPALLERTPERIERAQQALRDMDELSRTAESGPLQLRRLSGRPRQRTAVTLPWPRHSFSTPPAR